MSKAKVRDNQQESVSQFSNKDLDRLSLLVDELIATQKEPTKVKYKVLLAFLIACQVDLIAHEKGFKDRKSALQEVMKHDERLGLVRSILVS